MTHFYAQRTKKLGLSDREIEIYLFGLGAGPTTAQNIANATKIKRPTVYVDLERLKQIGLVNQSFKGKKKLYEMAPPEKLLRVIEKEKEEMEEKEEGIKNIITNLKAIANKAEFASDVRIFEGFEAIEETVGEFAKTKSPTYAISSGAYLEKAKWANFMKNIASVRERHKNKIYIITDLHPLEIKLYLMEDLDAREYRFLPLGIKLPSMMFMCEDKIALISLKEPYSSILIKNRTIAETEKFMFDVIWQSLERKNLPDIKAIEEARKVQLK
ncbi:helix-turn-helix domain-containing protein [Patescibacteria group bacterium]|nr:helix-turn-helix domain-containing protein [Patescibacteria group bacterium]